MVERVSADAFCDGIGELRKFLAQNATAYPQRYDLVYLMSHTIDNEKSVLDVGAQATTPVAVCGENDFEAISGYIGGRHYEYQLRNRRFGGQVIQILNATVEVGGKRIIHTLSELEALARYVANSAFKRVVVAAPPIQFIRSTLTATEAFKRHCPNVSLCMRVGDHQSLDERITHNQGKSVGLRGEFYLDELWRVFKYYFYKDANDLASPQDALALLTRSLLS